MNNEWNVRERRIASPAFILLICLAIGLLVDWLYPVEVLPTRIAFALGLLIIVASGPLAIVTFRAYARANTTFLFSEPTRAIVTDGPYRFSRNPDYISLSLLYHCYFSAWASC